MTYRGSREAPSSGPAGSSAGARQAPSWEDSFQASFPAAPAAVLKISDFFLAVLAVGLGVFEEYLGHRPFRGRQIYGLGVEGLTVRTGGLGMRICSSRALGGKH